MCVRVFYAIECDESLRKILSKRQNIIKTYAIKGNFTAVYNFHLTLKFIGEVSIEDLEILKSTLDFIAKDFTHFSLEFGHIGEFKRGNKSILWQGFNNSQSLTQLFNRLEDILSMKGYDREQKGLTPHITYGREIVLREPFSELNHQQKFAFKEDQVPFKVTGVSLMESTRINGMLTYKTIYRKAFDLDL